jgi:hypothetical protein
MERLCVSWGDGFDSSSSSSSAHSSSSSNSSNGETCKLRDSDAIIVASALNNGLVAFSRVVDSGSRFAERLSMSGRRNTAAQTLDNDAINVKSALIDSRLPSLVVRFRLRRDVENSRAGTTETFDATATPVDIIRGLNLDIKLPKDKFNILYVSLQQMPRRMERVGESGISRSGCSRRIDRYQ